MSNLLLCNSHVCYNSETLHVVYTEPSLLANELLDQMLEIFPIGVYILLTSFSKGAAQIHHCDCRDGSIHSSIAFFRGLVVRTVKYA